MNTYMVIIMAGDFYIFRRPSLPQYVKIILACSALFCFVAGLFLNSRAFSADGIFMLVFLCELFVIENKKKIFTILSIAVIILALYVIIISFVEMSKTISYFESAVNFLIFPFIAVSIILKFIVFLAVKDNKKELKGNERLFSYLSLIVSVLVLASVFLSVYVEFYFEPVIAFAIAIYCIYKAIVYLINRKKDPKEDEIPQDLVK